MSKTMKRESTVKYSISVTTVPGTISRELPGKISNLKSVLNAEFTDPVFLVKEMRKNMGFLFFHLAVFTIFKGHIKYTIFISQNTAKSL